MVGSLIHRLRSAPGKKVCLVMSTCMVVASSFASSSACGNWQGIGKSPKFGRYGLIGRTISPHFPDQNWFVRFLKGECRTVSWWWLNTLIHLSRQNTATSGLSKSVFALVILSNTFAALNIVVHWLPQAGFEFQASINLFKTVIRSNCTHWLYL